jgi:aspartyl/asparaginyl-tRNA synthetase
MQARSLSTELPGRVGSEVSLKGWVHRVRDFGGMGMGIERLLKQMLGLTNIKEASAFPRDRYRLTP